MFCKVALQDNFTTFLEKNNFTRLSGNDQIVPITIIIIILMATLYTSVFTRWFTRKFYNIAKTFYKFLWQCAYKPNDTPNCNPLQDLFYKNVSQDFPILRAHFTRLSGNDQIVPRTDDTPSGSHLHEFLVYTIALLFFQETCTVFRKTLYMLIWQWSASPTSNPNNKGNPLQECFYNIALQESLTTLRKHFTRLSGNDDIILIIT